MKWTEALEKGVYERLCACASTKEDLEKLVEARWGYLKKTGMTEKGFTKEDALVSVMEILDENGVEFDLTADEYAELCG